jgi:hypothetical protein
VTAREMAHPVALDAQGAAAAVRGAHDGDGGASLGADIFLGAELPRG